MDVVLWVLVAVLVVALVVTVRAMRAAQLAAARLEAALRGFEAAVESEGRRKATSEGWEDPAP